MDTKKVGERIKEIRKENGFSQQEFGKVLAVSQDTVSLWENGKSLPTAEFLIAMAQTFGISVDYILCLTDY